MNAREANALYKPREFRRTVFDDKEHLVVNSHNCNIWGLFDWENLRSKCNTINTFYRKKYIN